MKYIEEFRDRERTQRIEDLIRNEASSSRAYNLMEFCGGHTHAIFRFGLPDLLPPNIRMIHGPGCPVCVLPVSRVDQAIALSRLPHVVLCSYGDMLRVPGSNGTSLFKAKSEGADVRMVYSCMDALKIARDNPDRQVIFFAIGFETTTPPTAMVLLQAKKKGLKNFFVFCNHVLTPAAIQNILASPDLREWGSPPIHGFIGPAHVSAVIGTRPYEYFAEEYQRPVAIAGFEPLDILQAILLLVRQLNEGRAEVENQYTRVVTREGNKKAQDLVADIFELRKVFEWRGLGMVPYSGLRIKKEYAEFDAEECFDVPHVPVREPKGCECGAVLRGVKQPVDCKLFGTLCTPENPIGSCMVSAEGACAAYFAYGRHRAALQQSNV